MDTRIYLDYNATAPLRPEAQEAALHAMTAPHNASSVHGFGRAARKIVEDARTQVAALVGAPVNQVIFNSGATEGNNTVLHHFKGERILVSAIEHPSVLEATPHAARIPVTKAGIVDLEALEKLLKEKTGLVSVMLVNNETGAIQPLAEISALAKRHGALVHCDAVQAAGKIPVDIAALGVDFLTLSAHKIGGLQGAGALVLGLCGITPILLHGGGQEKKARGGTENVAAIASFGAAAHRAKKEMDQYQKISALRDHMEKEIQKISPEITIHAKNSPRVANTSLFSPPGAKSETMLMAFDLENICLSNGSACASGRVEASHVLKAMGAPDEQAKGALRVSMGWNTTPAEIDRFLEIWSKLYERFKDKTKAKSHA